MKNITFFRRRGPWKSRPFRRPRKAWMVLWLVGMVVGAVAAVLYQPDVLQHDWATAFQRGEPVRELSPARRTLPAVFHGTSDKPVPLGKQPGAVARTAASGIVGRASVVDGDTIEIHGTRIRLHGIDAPESGQTCTEQGRSYRCGQKAALALADRIGSRPVSCVRKDVDRYGRIVAVYRAGNEDLNGWIVSQGWALAYRRYSVDYIPHEEQAAASLLGMWRGGFVAPWEWRRGERLPATQIQNPEASPAKAATECLIKGNVSRTERIYHVPGGNHYDRTRIDASKGERWFCSEAETRAAGWRPSRR